MHLPIKRIDVVALSKLLDSIGMCHQLTANNNLVVLLDFIAVCELHIAQSLSTENVELVGSGAIVRDIVGGIAVLSVDFLNTYDDTLYIDFLVEPFSFGNIVLCSYNIERVVLRTSAFSLHIRRVWCLVVFLERNVVWHWYIFAACQCESSDSQCKH